VTARAPTAPRRGWSLREVWVGVSQTLLRLFPFPARTGLVAIGDPGPSSPVLLTGNFRLTVQRVRRALAGLDAWLVVANSRGINVWCAATGGLLTDHDVVSVLKTSGVDSRVTHRRVILPQLAATGIDGASVRRRSGWQVVWGPVEAADIPAFLAAPPGHGPRGRDPRRPEMRAMRTVTFPLRRRLEMAVAWAFPLSVPTLVLLPFRPRALIPAIGLVWGLALGVYAALPLARRWLRGTSSRSFGPITVDLDQLGLVLAAWLILVVGWLGVAVVLGRSPTDGAWAWGLGSLLILVVLGIDLSGSTPTYKSGLQADRLLAITLDEQRCTGAAFCAEVCPKDVFVVDHARRLATLPRADECVQCGACIVQCPFDALVFTDRDGASIPPAEIREYKLNLLGTRARIDRS
jgi:NAD-dependent dihydropyrimidine dehydrogenase PreA subunit